MNQILVILLVIFGFSAECHSSRADIGGLIDIIRSKTVNQLKLKTQNHQFFKNSFVQCRIELKSQHIPVSCYLASQHTASHVGFLPELLQALLNEAALDELCIKRLSHIHDVKHLPTQSLWSSLSKNCRSAVQNKKADLLYGLVSENPSVLVRDSADLDSFLNKP